MNSPPIRSSAGFIGRASALSGRVRAAGATDVTVLVGGVEWRLPAGTAPLRAGQEVRLMVRPEGLRFAPAGPGVLSGTVTERRFAGGSASFTVSLEGGTVEVVAAPRAARVGEAVGLVPADQGLHAFPAEGE